MSEWVLIWFLRIAKKFRLYAKKAYTGKIDELMSENVLLKMSLSNRINLHESKVSVNGSTDDENGLTIIAEQNQVIQEQQVRMTEM